MRQITIAVTVLMCALFTVAAAQFGEWSSPWKLESPVNSPMRDDAPTISKDGLSLYFARGVLGKPSGSDLSDYELMVSTRASVDEPWGSPVLLTVVNDPGYLDATPRLSLDEHRLYFISSRPGGCGPTGTYDLWVSRRQDRRDNFGWEPPVNLGCESDGYVNTPFDDLSPSFFEDESGAVIMYFASNRVPARSYDIYQSRMRNDDTFGPATPVSELNTAFVERGNAIRRDGLEIILESNRPGPFARADIWVATRESTEDAWGGLVNLTMLNTTDSDGGAGISMSFDGRTLYFTSNRGVGAYVDIFVTTREKLRGLR